MVGDTESPVIRIQALNIVGVGETGPALVLLFARNHIFDPRFIWDTGIVPADDIDV